MGSARIVTVGDLTNLFNYELRNPYQKQWSAAETLAYVNKWMEFVHAILTEHESELVKTGSGSFTTTEGTELYDLSDNSMGDLQVPVKAWISGLAELEMADDPEVDRMEYVIQDEQSSYGYGQPTQFYIQGDEIGLLPFPDSTTYTVNLKYIPDYTALTATASVMPYRNLFNNQLVEGVKIIAKNRENYGTSVDAALMELFQDRAMSIIRKRQVQNQRMVPVV